RGEPEVGLPVERPPLVRSGPAGPRGRGDGVGGRAERQDVEDHRLVVATPVVAEEPPLRAVRVPSQGDERYAGSGPLPIGAPVDRVGEPTDFGLDRIRGVEVRLAGEDSGEQ